MIRSVWKPLYNCLKKNSIDNLFFPHSLRKFTILKENRGKRVSIHNGSKLVSVQIKNKMVGFKFGQLSLTKARVIHQLKKKKKK